MANKVISLNSESDDAVAYAHRRRLPWARYLHPRYSRAQRERFMAKLLPRVKALTILALSYGIGLSIDAEEADRLEIPLDLLEALCFTPELDGWGMV